MIGIKHFHDSHGEVSFKNLHDKLLDPLFSLSYSNLTLNQTEPSTFLEKRTTKEERETVGYEYVRHRHHLRPQRHVLLRHPIRLVRLAMLCKPEEEGGEEESGSGP